MKNLNELLKILLESQINFVVIGGFAAVIHGSSRVTKDLDICISMSPFELEKLRKALKEYHPKHRRNPQNKLSFLEVPEKWEGLKNLYLETDLGILDVIGEVDGVGDFEKIRATATMVDLFGKKLQVMSIDHLILAKRSLGREKDLLDAKELEAIKGNVK